MQYTLSRSKRRRTIGITIKHGQVRVAAPEGVAQALIDAFVAEKHAWITRHVGVQRNQLEVLSPRRWQHGETIYWLGRPLRLEVRDGHRNTIEVIDKTLAIRLSRRVQDRSKQIRLLVTQWYRAEGQNWLDLNIEKIPPLTPAPTGWRIANYTAKWGACSHRGKLSFSWRLFAAPEWVVRYVVLHERCHLTHFNHSPQFWALVEACDGSYQNAEHWLKVHGHTLLNDNILSYVND